MDGVEFFALLTLFSNIFILYLLVLFILKLVGVKKLWNGAVKYLTKRGVILALLVAAASTSGSLYFSEVRKFTPCVMCWYQRILMYPLTVISAMALIKKTKDVYVYILPLSVLGILFASYHYYLQLNPEQLAPCSTVGFSVSCSDRFTTNYGYITIPFMSLTAFILITIFMFALSKKK